MKLQEIERRLCILNEKKVPVRDKRSLRGGMQGRLERQEVKRYSQDIKNQKAYLKKELDLIGTQEDLDLSILSERKLNKFNEPKLKKLRNKRSFF